jgi:hypothetical protein
MLETAAGNCVTTGRIVGSAAETPGTGKEGKLKCTGVTVMEGPTCTVSSGTEAAGTIVSNPLKATLVWLNSTGSAAGLKFQPESVEEFVKVKIAGRGLAGEYPVKGEGIGKLLPVATEVVAGELEFPKLGEGTVNCVAPNTIAAHFSNASPTRVSTATIHLTFKAQIANLCGNNKVELVSGEKAGVFPG